MLIDTGDEIALALELVARAKQHFTLPHPFIGVLVHSPEIMRRNARTLLEAGARRVFQPTSARARAAPHRTWPEPTGRL